MTKGLLAAIIACLLAITVSGPVTAQTASTSEDPESQVRPEQDAEVAETPESDEPEMGQYGGYPPEPRVVGGPTDAGCWIVSDFTDS